MKNIWTEQSEDGGQKRTDPLVMKILCSSCWGGVDRAEDQVHNPVQSLAGDVIPAGQLPVNPATAPLRPNKLISS